MENPQDDAIVRITRERWVVAWTSALLTCLLIVAIGYLVLRPIPLDLGGKRASTWFENQSAFNQSLAWGIQTGTVVGVEFYVFTAVKPQSAHRLRDAILAGMVTMFLISCCCFAIPTLLSAKGDLSDMMLSFRRGRWHDLRDTQELVDMFLLGLSGIVGSVQEILHIYAWYCPEPPCQIPGSGSA